MFGLQKKKSLRVKVPRDYAELQDTNTAAAAQAFSLLTEEYSSDSEDTVGSEEELRDTTTVFLSEDADDTNLVLL